MKKKLVIFTALLVSLTSLFSCKENDIASKDIHISEYYCGSYFVNSGLEIKNNSSKTISLKDYKINIYSLDNIKKTLVIDVNIESKSCVALLNKDFDKVDLHLYEGNFYDLDNNYLTGSNYIEIVNKNNKVCDCIGTKGYDLSFVSGSSLQKLEKYDFGYKTFNKLHYVNLKEDCLSSLGNTTFNISFDELMYGPRLSDIYNHGSILDETEAPTGNYTEVKVVSLGDGDTTVFNYTEESFLKSESTRYLLINTPEIAHRNGEEDEFMGREAKNYNNKILTEAKHILVQSNKTFALRETYGRILGYVWYTNVENPTLEDYRLLNYELLLNGYCRYDSRSKYETMYYKDMYYTNYFEYAYQYALTNKLRVFCK